MKQSEIVALFVHSAERLGIEYFITGSLASMFYGEPRFTNDADIAVEMNETEAINLCQAFPESDFYADPHMAVQAVRGHGTFNIIHSAGNLKIDVMIVKDTPFNRSRFARKRRVQFYDKLEAFISAPEDVILAKLLFFKEGRSEKHTRDVASIVKISWDLLDPRYLAGWALILCVQDIWRSILEKTGHLDAFPFDQT